MPEPKISRRCPTCGASIRAQAFFCPQCGGKLAAPGATPTREESAHIHDTVEDVVDLNQTMTEADFRARVAPQAVPDPGPAPEVPKKSAPPRALAEGSKMQRVTNKARVVEDDVKQRVQKLRDMSGVVIEEASYDPSLRFVLVAAALVVVFLVIALLNNLIG
jgi:hypothetical protein